MFLAADFDKVNWQKEANTFLNACKEKETQAYLEHYRSGNVGLIWIFENLKVVLVLKQTPLTYMKTNFTSTRQITRTPSNIYLMNRSLKTDGKGEIDAIALG